MSLISFLQNNFTPLLALLGVLIGGLIAALSSFVTQSLQRKWQLRDRISEREIIQLQQKIQLVIQWQEQWMRLAAHVRSAEGSSDEAKKYIGFINKIRLNEAMKYYKQQEDLLTELFAITQPIVIAIGDITLIELSNTFRELASQYKDISHEKNIAEAISSNIHIISEITRVMAETHKRADYLLIHSI